MQSEDMKLMPLDDVVKPVEIFIHFPQKLERAKIGRFAK